MLSNELSTIIGGRYKEIYIQSLSYNEFLQFHHLVDNDEALALYIQYGGLPGLAKIGLEEDDALVSDRYLPHRLAQGCHHAQPDKETYHS